MALDFDGTATFVTHGNIADMNSAATLSCAVWLMPDVLAAKYLWSKWTAGNGTLCGVTSSGSTFLAFDGTGIQGAIPENSLTNGVWNHLVYVFNGNGVGNAGRLQIYLDGVSQVLTFQSTIPATTNSNTVALNIARLSDGTANFDCKVAHMKFWSVALTSAEAAQEVNSVRPTRTAGLYLWAPYDDSLAGADYSGSANHGVVTTSAAQTSGPPVGYGFPSATVIV